MTACDGVAQDEEGGLASRRESAHVHAVGRAAGAAMPALRKDNGATRDAPYTPGTGPGQWRPHPNPDPPNPPNPPIAPDYAPSSSTGWGNVTPFTLLTCTRANLANVSQWGMKPTLSGRSRDPLSSFFSSWR
jgi:hypothetical protein